MNVKLLLLLSLFFAVSALQEKHCFRYTQCSCTSNTVTCSNADLPWLPPFHSYTSVTRINLTNINIKVVNISLGYPYLKVLNIHENPLEVVRFKHFDFSTLKEVNVDDNKIEKLITESENLPESLEVFSARNNRLSALGADADFTKFHKLTHLHLSGNSFHDYNSEWFPDSLVLLDLSRNDLKSLEPVGKDFKSLGSLQYLLLAYNKIETVEEEGLPSKLAALDVSHNKITSIDLLKLNRNLTLNISGNIMNCSCSFVKSFQTAVKENGLEPQCDPNCVTCLTGSVVKDLTNKTQDLDALCPGTKSANQAPTQWLIVVAIICLFVLLIAAGVYFREKMGERVSTLENESEDGTLSQMHETTYTSNENLVNDDYVAFSRLQMADNQRLASVVEYNRNAEGPIYAQVPRVQPRAVFVF